jgi:hypothetical protein
MEEGGVVVKTADMYFLSRLVMAHYFVSVTGDSWLLNCQQDFSSGT